MCQVNPNCSLPEAVQLPTVSDVCFSLQPSGSTWMGASLDFKAAHKQVKVRKEDQGLLLLEFANQLYGYVVSPPGTLCNIPPRMWPRFLFSLDCKAVVAKPVPGLRVSTSAKVIEVGSLKIRRKSDVPLFPSSDRLTWVRIADPSASEIALTKNSEKSFTWLLSCVQATPTKPLSDPHLLRCLSAADAMAEGDTVGIGGWLCTKDGLRWFSEIWPMSEVCNVWLQLHKDAQKYIACFATLAQLALPQMAHSRLGHRYMSFAMPAGSDNTPTEAGVHKLFSTAWLADSKLSQAR